MDQSALPILAGRREAHSPGWRWLVKRLTGAANKASPVTTAKHYSAQQPPSPVPINLVEKGDGVSCHASSCVARLMPPAKDESVPRVATMAPPLTPVW